MGADVPCRGLLPAGGVQGGGKAGRVAAVPSIFQLIAMAIVFCTRVAVLMAGVVGGWVMLLLGTTVRTLLLTMQSLVAGQFFSKFGTAIAVALREGFGLSRTAPWFLRRPLLTPRVTPGSCNHCATST